MAALASPRYIPPMRTEQPVTPPAAVNLADYKPPAFLVESAHLTFALDPHATRVKARLEMRRNPAREPGLPLVLDGVRLKPISVALNGETLGENAAVIGPESLTIADVPDAFVLETEVEVDPAANKALEGLYMSSGRWCTQCEAEGFRKITFWPDRPDVLARFTVRIEADATVENLLSNGNLVDFGDLPDGRRFAVWEDPFPKPSYLFALVAGELDVLEDRFTTMSGREVALKIYVDPGSAERATYAMDALKRSMRWDEETYGREYDLDLFMIVAVRDFNMGAMENKGLNVFNSSLILADPETATDLDYERIEGVVAHEYFHNWTGNRITCRDWFQLCLKEGLTVFRDQGFSADMRGHAVQRIKEVRQLRARQFAEDAGPLAHPVRPKSYVKIDNFYTATVYEKGAELIGVLKTLIGNDAFRRGMNLYFDRFDGTAATMEDFWSCFAEASGRDLSAFTRWYDQAGTPRLDIAAMYDTDTQVLTLDLAQSTPATPGQADKGAVVLPIRLGLLDEDGGVQAFADPATGERVEEIVYVLDQPSARVELKGVARLPVLSALRGFSAPVVLTTDEPERDPYVRLAHDPDLFNRWEAGQGLARDLILRRAYETPNELNEERYAQAAGEALRDAGSDHAFKALLLALPLEGDLALARTPADPAALHAAREALRTRLAVHLAADLREMHTALQQDGEFSPDAAQAGRRALRNALIDLIVADGTADAAERARGHFEAAADMTGAMGGLSALMATEGELRETALGAFYDRWKGEPLVVDKWFGVQARDPSDGALGRVLGLTAHPAFDPANPNRLRALVSGFAVGNPTRFHAPDGQDVFSGHRFLADQILATDAINPMTAARMVDALGGWRRYVPAVGESMRRELQRLADHPAVSANVLELASRALA